MIRRNQSAWGREKVGASGVENLDGGVDGVPDHVRLGLPGAVPHRGDLGAGVEHEAPRHLFLCLTHTH